MLRAVFARELDENAECTDNVVYVRRCAGARVWRFTVLLKIVDISCRALVSANGTQSAEGN